MIKSFIGGKDKAVRSLSRALKGAFLKIKEEFDEHLDTINQNTNEIQSNYEFLCELDSKIDKLSQRIDDLQMYVADSKDECSYVLNQPVGKLTIREQEVFMVLYTAENENLTYPSIAKRLGFSEAMVKNYLSSISAKGVPIVKKCVGENVYISIESAFRNYQAKENILEINENLARQFI